MLIEMTKPHFSGPCRHFNQYQDSNELAFRFEDIDTKLYHCLFTLLEFERQTSSAARFDQ